VSSIYLVRDTYINCKKEKEKEKKNFRVIAGNIVASSRGNYMTDTVANVDKSAIKVNYGRSLMKPGEFRL